jgi:hypothetical protein
MNGACCRYDATVESAGDDWIVVYFDEFDYSAEMPLDEEHVVINPKQPAATSKGEGGHGRRTQRAARVPAPPLGSPHKAAREALPVFEHRAELLEAIESNQVRLLEGVPSGCKAHRRPSELPWTRPLRGTSPGLFSATSPARSSHLLPPVCGAGGGDRG